MCCVDASNPVRPDGRYKRGVDGQWDRNISVSDNCQPPNTQLKVAGIFNLLGAILRSLHDLLSWSIAPAPPVYLAPTPAIVPLRLYLNIFYARHTGAASSPKRNVQKQFRPEILSFKKQFHREPFLSCYNPNAKIPFPKHLNT